MWVTNSAIQRSCVQTLTPREMPRKDMRMGPEPRIYLKICAHYLMNTLQYSKIQIYFIITYQTTKQPTNQLECMSMVLNYFGTYFTNSKQRVNFLTNTVGGGGFSERHNEHLMFTVYGKCRLPRFYPLVYHGF